ncbi:ester cyclase [Maribacter litopenaei]|uniref:Ester cyclase n=1 Tax=Maribacter litopenaei TaxID=2976127 RepID=A0ABY5YAE3_9FLAO|nr:ester cyclase [Maribacter litopenaei]UWX56002.1 ester cyclase [Maribacter litopenaei]
MRTNFKTTLKGLLTLIIFTTLSFSCSDDTSQLRSKIDALETELKAYKQADSLKNARLTVFDTLDFEYYTNQKWERFGESHSEDIVVYNADGSITKGLHPQHINDLSPMFVFAPDTRIEKHPVRFGNGDWTAVIGELEGTFTEPMPLGNGQTIPPTGKKFKLRMATIGHWKDGKMTEEYLFYDNQSFLKQIGLAQ